MARKHSRLENLLERLRTAAVKVIAARESRDAAEAALEVQMDAGGARLADEYARRVGFTNFCDGDCGNVVRGRRAVRIAGVDLWLCEACRGRLTLADLRRRATA